MVPSLWIRTTVHYENTNGLELQYKIEKLISILKEYDNGIKENNRFKFTENKLKH
jgi:hypothetical protein